MASSVLDFNVGVVLPASGTGERMGTSRPKQFCDILGKPVILYTLMRFHRWTWIQYIVVVVSEQYKEMVESLVNEYNLSKVTVTVGSTTRHRSIRNGIRTVHTVCNKPEVVLIHDAVRLFVEEDLVRDIALAAYKIGAAGVSRPLVSTVIGVDSDNIITESLDRSQYCASEMPQAFKYPVILDAYNKCTNHDLDYGTECLHLAMKYGGVRAQILPGKSTLWKVTYKRDLYAATGMLKEEFLNILIVHSIDCKVLADNMSKLFVAEFGEAHVHNLSSLPEINLVDHNTVIQFSKQMPTDFSLCHIERTKANASGILTPCYIYVCFLTTGEIATDYFKMCVSFKKSVSSFSNVLIYAVVANDTDTVEDITRLVKQLAWDRSAQLSGQVLLV